jgi:hypothetical protein
MTKVLTYEDMLALVEKSDNWLAAFVPDVRRGVYSGVDQNGVPWHFITPEQFIDYMTRLAAVS